jgi:uncharacterized protein YeaO (DUF488 family)
MKPKPREPAPANDPANDPKAEIEQPGAEKPIGGPRGRAKALADGIAIRVAKRDGAVLREADGRTVLEIDGRLAARWALRDGYVDVEVDPRSGVADEVTLRRVGMPHPDRERSKAGWRLIRVRTHRDASRVVSALKAPRVKATGEERGSRRMVMRTELLVGSVHVRRLEDAPRPDDGARIFVDLEKPHGYDARRSEITAWMPEVAPGPKIREVFGPVPARTRGFRRVYLQELKGSSKASYVSKLRHLAQQGPLTLVTAVRDVALSHAAVLVQAITKGRTPRG